MNTNDPIELIVAAGLTRAGIVFVHESDNKAQALDFYLPDYDLLIEVKQFSTPRTTKQLENRENVILVQGRQAASQFVRMINAK